MRDPNRIDPFLQELGTIWKNNCPDWRFGQLMFNTQRVMQSHGTDIFYMEEDELLQYFREWFDVDSKKKHEMAKRRRRKVCTYPERRHAIDETQCHIPKATVVFDGDVPLTHKLSNIKNFEIFVDDKEEK